MDRTVIKITGSSGTGLLTAGDIIIKSLKKLGFYVNADREYPSLIKGGYSSYQIDFSTNPVHSLSTKTDILIALDEPGMINYISDIKKKGIMIHGHERHDLMPHLKPDLRKRGAKMLYLPAREIAHSFGGNDLMVNMVLMGLLWCTLGFDLKNLEEEVSDRFASKPKLLEIDLKCLKAGYEAKDIKKIPKFKISQNRRKPKKILINGNYALALGAIQAGVRNYYAYPMSPSSSILSYLAAKHQETGMVVKQAEDEITAVQMTIGSMFVGSRALVATSGGGFDLMTESISAAGIMETPLVIVLCQRPGPGTGLPTWTGQGDLNLAIHCAHGEFAKVVIAVSDPTSCYELIQHALNIAEKFQTQVIVLSEKVICETQMMVPSFKHKKIPIQRGLVIKKSELAKLHSFDRYKITKSGVSKRWIPGSSKAYYYSNADEHWEGGQLTEEADQSAQMYAKRVRKEEVIKKSLPEPKIYGPKSGADISFIGWGSSKNVMMDVIEAAKKKKKKVNYLHYEYMWPFKDKVVRQFFKNNKKVCLLEGNYRGQLGQIIEDKTGNKFKKKHLKYNGRPFFFDEVMGYL